MSRDIEEVVGAAFRERTGGGVAPGEFRAWRESLLQMGRILHDEGIPDRAGVAIEYKIPQTNKRIDFIITGLDESRSSKAVIVELKQWSEARRTKKDGIVLARRGGRASEIEGPHPSYQAWSYAALLETFNAAVYEGGIGLRPCAYLHNYERDGQIDHPFYAPHIQRAPPWTTLHRLRPTRNPLINRGKLFKQTEPLLRPAVRAARLRPWPARGGGGPEY